MATKAGVSIIEVKADDPKLQRIASVRRLKDLLSSYDFQIAVHAPYIDLNPASLKPPILMATRRALLNGIRIAQTLEADYFICHPGRFPPEYPRMLRRRALMNMTRLLQTIVQQSSNTGVKVLLENLPKEYTTPFASTPEELKEISSNLGIRIALDLGHANTIGDPQQFIDALSEVIEVIHIHDNHGELDEHLQIGRGTLRVRGCIASLSRIKYEGALILQVRNIPGLLNSIRFMRSMLSRIGSLR